MLEQLARVSRVVRLHHLLKLIRHPGQEIAAFKYHYRRVPERAFVAFLSGIPPAEAATIERVYADLQGHAARFAALTTRLAVRSEEHTSELQSLAYLVCRLLLEKKKRVHKFSIIVIEKDHYPGTIRDTSIFGHLIIP